MRQVSKLKLLVLAAVLGALLAGGWMALQAVGKQNGIAVKALNYDDRVRFVVEGQNVSILRAEVFDLAGRRLFDSGPIAGKALDWTMTTMEGERVAHGVYLYVITAWDSQGQLLKSQVGKLALVPGGVGLGQAPPLVSGSEGARAPEGKGVPVVPLAVDVDHSTESWAFRQVGIGTTNPGAPLHVYRGSSGASPYVGALVALESNTSAYWQLLTPNTALVGFMFGDPEQQEAGRIYYQHSTDKMLFGTANAFRAALDSSGRFGIGTVYPAATLEVKGSDANLLVLKDPADNTVFRVEKDGDVYADRSYHCGLSTNCFNAGTGADVAERIDISGSVEPGDVVEIDPEHPGLYRKAQEPYSTRVVGAISTAPAITLGNTFDPEAERWEDSRPLLALAGRVPVRATTENGPIKIGDFLTTSSTPGYAMRCENLWKCTGAILGKALEPLEEGTGVIQVQVTLR